jgi:hypothetical protein
MYIHESVYVERCNFDNSTSFEAESALCNALYGYSYNDIRILSCSISGLRGCLDSFVFV